MRRPSALCVVVLVCVVLIVVGIVGMLCIG
jgi:hypothetical protein